ncbi:MAG TPA: hypothetical protein VEK33_02735 [Terriglobales bacterium]|nr:hypothetical protein [Terriglobales bacterium]
MTQDVWLAKHPYLQPVADLQALVQAAAADVSIPSVCIPRWDDYSGDFYAGVPLLLSSRVTIDLHPLEEALASLAETLS